MEGSATLMRNYATTAQEALADLELMGAPLFLLPPGKTIKGKYRAPTNWQDTNPDGSSVVIEGWTPEHGVGMVCGVVYDVVDVDPRNGGEVGLAQMQADGALPPVYYVVKTPSGGLHLYVTALGVPKGKPYPGIDYQAGTATSGRGFVFCPPTAGYEEVPRDEWPKLVTGNRAAAKLRAKLAKSADAEQESDTTVYDALAPELQEQARARIERTVTSFETRLAVAAEWADGEVDERGRGWEKLCADAAYGLAQLGAAPWTGMTMEEAEDTYLRILPDAMLADEKCSGKWDHTARRALKKPVPAPWQEAASDFIEEYVEMKADPTKTPFENEVAALVHKMMVTEEAKRQMWAETVVIQPLPEPMTLADLLALPRVEAEWRVKDMWPSGGRVNLVAAAKSGKTTTTANLIRALVDGGDFLGYPVEQLKKGETITLFDTEMTENQLADWYRDLDLKHPEKLKIVPLVGIVTGLNFLDQLKLRELVDKYKGSAIYILDPVGPLLTGLGLEENSNSDVQRFLTGWDTFVSMMGGKDSMITQHAGHSEERARGASAFLGSGSAIWTLMNSDPKDVSSPRFIKAVGRDVNLPETALHYDPVTRSLSLGLGNRALVKQRDAVDKLVDIVVEAVTEQPGMSVSELTKYLKDDGETFRNADLSKAVGKAEGLGLVWTAKGGDTGRKKELHPTSPDFP